MVCGVIVQGDHCPLRAEGKLTEDSVCFPCPSRQPVSAPFLHEFLDLLQQCVRSNAISWPLAERLGKTGVACCPLVAKISSGNPECLPLSTILNRNGAAASASRRAEDCLMFVPTSCMVHAFPVALLARSVAIHHCSSTGPPADIQLIWNSTTEGTRAGLLGVHCVGGAGGVCSKGTCELHGCKEEEEREW